MAAARTGGTKEIAQNRKAFHDYFILDRFEAGIELFGTEVKSVRNGNVNLKDSFCTVKDGELYARNLHISPYEQGNRYNKDPMRPKKLLLHKLEIRKLDNAVTRDGYTIVPLQVYFSQGRAKIEIALAKGKKLYDKREDIAKKDQRREHEREFKVKNLY